MIKISFLSILTIGALYAQIDDKISRVSELLKNNRIADAKSILAGLYKENNKEPRVNYYLGVVSLRENNYDDAIDYIDAAIDGDNTNPQYYFMLGNAYGVKVQRAGVFSAIFAASKIKSNWEKAIELKPDFIDAYINLFQFHLQAPGIAGGSIDEAMEIISKVGKLNKYLEHALRAYYYLIEDESYQDAETELAAVLQADQTDPDYHQIKRLVINLLNIFGYHYLRNNMLNDSRRYFSLAIKTAPDQANPYDSMGDYYANVAAYDSALICYENALKINPEFTISKLKKGRMLEKLNRRSEAVDVYQTLIKDDPESDYAEEAEDRLEEIGP